MWRANDSPLQSRIWVFFNVKNVVVVVVGKLSGGYIRKERGREEQVIGQVKQSPACTLTDEKWISFFLTAVGTRKPTRTHADCPQGGRWKSPTGKKRKRTPTYTDSQKEKKKKKSAGRISVAGISCNCISAQNDARGLAPSCQVHWLPTIPDSPDNTSRITTNLGLWGGPNWHLNLQ